MQKKTPSRAWAQGWLQLSRLWASWCRSALCFIVLAAWVTSPSGGGRRRAHSRGCDLTDSWSPARPAADGQKRVWWAALSVTQLRGREPATPAQRLRLQVKLSGLRLVPSQLSTIGRRCCRHGLCSTDPSAPFACDLPGHPPERGHWLSEPHFTWLSRSLCRPHSCSVINSAELFYVARLLRG